MSSTTSTIAKTRSELFQTRLGSALRTTLACSIVGITALYSPEHVKGYIKFPSISYVTTILIVSDATLGETVKGCWHVLCATIQVMIFSLLSLQVIRPGHFSDCMAALAVALGAFLVSLPVSTNLLTKRIAYAQLVIIYVSTVIYGAKQGVATHSIHVACSTALGAIASVLAMLLPYPRVAYYEAKKFYQLYTENTSERLNCNIDAISASDNSTAVGYKTRAKYLSTTGAKLLHCVTTTLDGMYWERPQSIISNSRIELEEKLQDLDIPIRGMDIALSSGVSFPVGVIDEELRGVLLDCRGQISQKLDQQAKCFVPFDATIDQEMKQGIFNKYLSIACKDLPTSFFLYCVQLLLDDVSISKKTDHALKKAQKSVDCQSCFNKISELLKNLIPSNKGLIFALKSSLSLGLAVLLGLMYDRTNAYWSGLTIAISFVTGRQPTFSVANARGQGTAFGSIYGIICSFIFQKYVGIVDLRFLALIPWVIFASFLRHSKMYGQSGAISAVLGALLILGRKNYSTPPEFGVARMAEATIGLTCLIIVEIILSPSRAATLAKSELSQTLKTLQDCIKQIAMITPSERELPSSSYQALREEQKKLKSLVCQLREFTAEAEVEPNFWFLPFHNACYNNMLKSLSRTVDLLLFVAYSMEHVTQLAQKDGVVWMDIQGRGNENVKIFKDKVDPILKSLEEITRMKSVKKIESDLKSQNVPHDLESQEGLNADTLRILSRDEEVDSITNSFLQHLEEIADKTHTNKDEETLKVQMLFHYSSLGFCTSSLMREIGKIESEIRELCIWENPSSETNFK
ncbi:uncharacterized protein LOC131610067 [Vicia villosa]|uniref:uncharacterized protein LOC131610067 n=1 Tax=Vicia villosa TaxID=3911 RepID=UPI00273BD173|nr:uncharacterized protein LOC131610067 [Vicia villosa]